jgi:L-threonylcarbamoyladenylate synthase
VSSVIRRIVTDPVVPAEATITEAAEVLRRGGVVAYPTDTLYGLGVDPRCDAAVERLFALKGRGAGAAIALIAADAAQAEGAGRFGPVDRRLAAAFWPGPLTIVVPAAAAFSPLLSPRGTVGVRVPAHAVARALACALGECLTATSANRSGEMAAVTADEVSGTFGGGIDLLLDAGPAPGGPPSTIVEVIGSRLTLHRAGAIAWERVLESIE